MPFAWNSNDLNEEQKNAVFCEGSVFLTACPGSGKTRCLSHKIVHALEHSMASEKRRVVAITYTQKAAEEIHDRISQLVTDTSKLWIGTIHAFCLEWILRPYAIYHEQLKNGFRVINSHDTEEIISEICKSKAGGKVGYYDCGYFYTSSGRHLTSNKSRLHNVISEVLDEYHEQISSRKQIDFELILKFAHDLIQELPSISKLLSSIFSIVLVDEFQDTKEIQYLILATILRAGQGETDCFMVGDANQAIYSSMGGVAMSAAEFGALAGIKFTELSLEKNYRSSEAIVEYFKDFALEPGKVLACGPAADFNSIISFDDKTNRNALSEELVRLIKFNIEEQNISPSEICVIAPWWTHLASMTRSLVAALPDYQFDGPGLVPFARDQENFFYRLSKIALSQASPKMFVRRSRWASDIIMLLSNAGLNMEEYDPKALLRLTNSITPACEDGLEYLTEFFDLFFDEIGVDIATIPTLREHSVTFFEAAQRRIDRMVSDGAPFATDINTFRKVFSNRTGITVSSIHGVKGEEFDTVIAYALLEDMVPHFSDPEKESAAKKMLYVIGSRARKNLHLISERGRQKGHNRGMYDTTKELLKRSYEYNDI